MRFFDTLSNLVTSMGTAKDKSTQTQYGLCYLDPQQLIAAYRGDWIARKVVDIPAFDMSREGWEWQAEKVAITALEAEEKRLQVTGKLFKALKLARLLGGAALVMGVGDDDPTQEMRPDSIRKGGLSYLHVMSRYELGVQELNRDPLSPYYGEPKYYSVNSQSRGPLNIHPSRVIRILGAECPDGGMFSASGVRNGIVSSWGADPAWGDSVLQALDDAVKNAGVASAGIASLVQEAKLDIYKIPGLMERVGTQEYRDRLLQRFGLAGQAKSLINGLLLDKEEEYEQKTINFSQLPEILRLYLEIAAGAADIPATRMLGQAPTGLNATGEGDIRNYYDRVSAEQNLTLRPPLDRLMEVLIRSALGARPPEVHYNFRSLWQLTATEKADIALKKAETAELDLNCGLIPRSSLAKARQNQAIEDGSYPGLEQAIQEAPSLPQPEAPIQKATPALPEKPSRLARAANDAAPRTLYVSRKVLNPAEIRDWARSQGFKSMLKASDLHVTIAYSRAPVDWMAVGSDSAKVIVPAGGPRVLERFGSDGAAVVLLFSSWDLDWRHRQIMEAGASWDWPDFQPHITITYAAPEGFDVSKVKPYTGRIVLGPEIFAELDADWSEKASETDLAA